MAPAGQGRRHQGDAGRVRAAVNALVEALDVEDEAAARGLTDRS